MNNKKIRLNRYISQCGVCSRRKADDLIKAKKVYVNGKLINKLGHLILPNKDKIKIGNKHLVLKNYVYYVFNKPKQVLSTLSDPKGRLTIADFLKNLDDRVFPVGRLDWDAEGLMVLTNDGELANKISHPKWGVDKTYLVKLKGNVTNAQLNKLKTGVSILGGKVKARYISKITKKDKNNDWVKITISEGKNRQIKRMFEKIKFDVLKIKRISIGNLSIGKLRKGQIKEINKSSIFNFKNLPQKIKRNNELPRNNK